MQWIWNLWLHLSNLHVLSYTHVSPPSFKFVKQMAQRFCIGVSLLQFRVMMSCNWGHAQYLTYCNFYIYCSMSVLLVNPSYSFDYAARKWRILSFLPFHRRFIFWWHSMSSYKHFSCWFVLSFNTSIHLSISNFLSIISIV